MASEQQKTVGTLRKFSELSYLDGINEEPAMRNLIIDGAAGGEIKIRHDVTFPLN
jgi:hypothetical protein